MEWSIAGPSDSLGTSGLRILCVSRGEPTSASSFSGITANLVRALERREVFGAGVDAGLPRAAEVGIGALSYRRDREAWRQRHLLSPTLRRALTHRALSRAAPRLPSAPDVLQIGAWFDLGRLRPHARLICSYNDGNTAELLRRPDLSIDPGGAAARRALAFERSVANGLDLILTLSEHLRRSFIDDLGQSPHRVVAVGAGANLTRVPGPVDRGGGPPRFLFVGRQFARKGGQTVLRAFSAVRARFPQATLTIVGPDEAPDGMGAGVTFVGRVHRSEPDGDRRMEALYRDATAFVMPSVFEPFGIVFLEAMANRLPCIGSTAGAMPEIIADGETGFVVPPGDDEALAGRMLTLAGSPELCGRMGEAGFRRFEERYTWDAVARRIDEAMADAVRANGSRA